MVSEGSIYQVEEGKDSKVSVSEDRQGYDFTCSTIEVSDDRT